MSKHKALARWQNPDTCQGLPPVARLALDVTSELEAIRAEYEARISRLEFDVERLTERVGDLEVRCG